MSTHDELARLFEAERVEQPPSDALGKGWLDLSSSLDAGVQALPVAPGPLKLGLSVASKWLLGSGLTALTVGASAVALSRPVPTAPPTRVVAPVATSNTSAPTPAKPTPISAPVTEEEIAKAPKPTPSPSASAQASTFADELRLIRLAKQELDAARPHLAQVWLDEHGQHYPKGVFASERAALQVLLTCQRSPEAGREAALRFARYNPGSPLLDRISRACGRSLQPEPVPSGSFPDWKTDK